MRLIFIFLTQEANLASVAGMRKFEPGLGLNPEKPFFLWPFWTSTTNLTKENAPQLLLVYDQLTVEDFCKNIELIAANFDKIYFAWHENGKIHPKDIQDRAFFSKMKEEKGIHKKNNKIYGAAVGFLRNDANAFSNALRAFDGHTLLNTLITTYKELNNIPMTLPSWDEDSFMHALAEVKSKPERALIADLISEIKFDHNQDNFYLQLAPVELAIKTLS